jgi:hypothetical protein
VFPPTPGISVTTAARPSRSASRSVGAHCSLTLTMPPMISTSGRGDAADMPVVQHRTTASPTGTSSGRMSRCAAAHCANSRR